MFRQTKLKYWKRKRPLEGKTYAKSIYCLSDHFHRSMLEGQTCNELRLRKIAKDIKDYRVEVTFPLELNGVRLGSYRADFVVECNDGTKEIVEAKGIIFNTFRIKWNIMQAMYPEYKFIMVRK